VFFIGSHRCALDQKNRIAVPARFREGLAENDEPDAFYVVRGLDGNLLLFAESGWDRIRQGVDALQRGPFGDAAVRRFARIFYESAERCPLDKQGRILLPDRLVSMGGIKRDAIFIGVSDRIELWSAERYEATEAPFAADDEFQRMARALFGSGGQAGGGVPGRTDGGGEGEGEDR